MLFIQLRPKPFAEWTEAEKAEQIPPGLGCLISLWPLDCLIRKSPPPQWSEVSWAETQNIPVCPKAVKGG
jgi:hypothetical protein